MTKRMVSIGLAALCFAALSGVAVVIFQGMRQRTLLESRNDGERTINQLFSSLRNYDDFGSAIETMPSLSRKVIGVALFAEIGTRWVRPPQHGPRSSSPVRRKTTAWRTCTGRTRAMPPR